MPQEESTDDRLMAAALEELEQAVGGGLPQCSEQILHKFPDVAADQEALLELLYTEFTLRTELNPGTEVELVEEFRVRFPQLQQELVQLFQVGKVLTPLLSEDREQATPRGDASGSSAERARELMPWQMGDYEIIDVLGQGGMGIVYKARQRSLERIVALKTVDVLRDLDLGTARQLTKEAELASQLQHPNIVQIFEIGLHDQTPFFSMEFVAGGTLADALRQHPLSPTTAAKLIAAVARAVGYAHEQRVIHRDLKPSNILLAPSDRPEALTLRLDGVEPPRSLAKQSDKSPEKKHRYEPKVADFGLATVLEEGTDQRHALGTPSYMAPEQIDARFGTVGIHSDVYALGSILYHCLAGRPPFQAPSLQETLSQVRSDEPQPLSAVVRRLPKDLELICAKCLHKDPKCRYATATDLADDLQRFLSHNPIRAKAPSWFELASKWSKRHPSATGLIALSLLTACMATYFWSAASRRAATESVARERAERILYGSQIALAANELRAHDLIQSRQILDGCEPGYRDWEWTYLKNLASKALWESPPTTMPANSADISPDGKLAVGAIGLWGKNLPQPIDVWDVDANRILWTFDGHPESQVKSVRFSPDGTKLLSAAAVISGKEPGRVLEWSLTTGQLHRIVAEVNASAAAYVPDGSSIIVGTTSGQVQILDAASGALLSQHSEHASSVHDIACGANGRFITTSYDGVVCLRNLQGELLDIMNDMGDARQVVWFPGSERVWIQGYSGIVQEFEVRENKFHFIQQRKEEGFSYLAPSPDSMTYAQAGFGEGVELRLVHNRQLLRELHGHRGNVRVISFAGKAHRALTGGADGVLRVWDMRSSSSPAPKILSGGGAVADFVCHPGQHELALAICKSEARSAVFTGSPRLEIRDPENMQLLRSVDCHNDWLSHVAYSPKGDWLATGSLDCTVCVWDARSLEKVGQFSGHTQPIACVCFVDESTVISMDQAGQLRVWDARTGELSSSLDFAEQLSGSKPLACYLPTTTADRTRVLVVFPGKESRLQLWDWARRSLLREWTADFEVHALTHSLAANLVAVAGEGGKCHVYDVAALAGSRPVAPTQIVIGNASKINSLAFSPNGQRLCTAAEDETVRVFDAQLGTELLNFDGPSGRFGIIRFTFDGGSLFRFNGRNYALWTARHQPAGTDDAWAMGMAQIALTARNHTALQLYCDESIRIGYNVQQARELKLQSATQQFQPSAEETREETREEMREAFQELLDNHADATSGYILKYLILSGNTSEAQQLLRRWQTTSQANDPLFVNATAWYAALMNADAESLKFWGDRLRAAHRRRKQPYYANTLALVEYRLGNFDASVKLARESLLLDRNMATPLDWLIELAALLAKSQTLDSTSEPSELPKIRQQAQSTLSSVEGWSRAQRSRRESGLEDNLSRLQIYQFELPIVLAEVKAQLQKTSALADLPWGVLELIASGPSSD